MNEKDVIQEAIGKIDQVTKLFYEQNQTEAYQELDGVLVSITNAVDVIWKKGMGKDELMQALTEAMQALENRDSILLADILLYEVKEQLEDVLKCIN